MDPVSALIVGGSMITAGGISAGSATATNKAQRGFAREMWKKQLAADNTAVQRRVADLQAAGLNPLLAAGSAAGSPGAVSAGSFTSPGKAFADQIDPTILMSLEKERANIDATRAQEALLDEQARKVKLDNELTSKTIKWYDDNPNFAPNVNPGIYTGTGASSILGGVFSKASDIGSKLGEYIGEKYYNITHPNRPKVGHYDKNTHKMVYEK